MSLAEIAAFYRPDIKDLEASRPPWDSSLEFRHTQKPDPKWQLGDGADKASASDSKFLSIDPYSSDRTGFDNYKLLTYAISPRPIALVSTRTKDGLTENLAPFSYFNGFSSDPPLFMLGFVQKNDTLRNLLETKECVISITTEENMLAVNAAGVNAPANTSEWPITGLTPVYDCVNVKCPRVKETAMSIECKLDSVHEWKSHNDPDVTSTIMVIIEGTHFWIREDATNEKASTLHHDVARPVLRGGGISYFRTLDATQLPSVNWELDVGGSQGYAKLEEQFIGKNNVDAPRK
ncbi:hypothetical protein FOCG_17735 [Fusarium oxysporum f. sp. radicis-lycopersici 26381]|uniref:Flavin reductase like domain-containing protein n=1 Tax=Fusarium oxysporum f. sp. melonis 26406 TaxID=1089452 RepID=W9Z2N0_FUSOX|nr:hypothetical protein FOMG_17687 [Fusarium oxysporum f. sp. melonis 26406]EXL39680.1 hypothetical protein FOCG_17735 [Fusarium oxysporum f. sp. radicis-lycopersici 26381]